MTHHRPGNADQAKASLARLRESMKQGEPSEDAKAFLKQAEALIEGKKTPTGLSGCQIPIPRWHPAPPSPVPPRIKMPQAQHFSEFEPVPRVGKRRCMTSG